MIRNYFAAMYFSLVWTLPAIAGTGLIKKESSYPVGETINRLEKTLKEKGMTIFTKIDHSKNSGGKIPGNSLLIFGNPAIGSQLMAASQSIGIDLPMKALVYEEKGKVWISYNDPKYLADRHSISDKTEVLNKMSTALKKVTDTATGGKKS